MSCDSSSMAKRPFSICSEVFFISRLEVLELTNTEDSPIRISRPMVIAVISSISEKPWEARFMIRLSRRQRADAHRRPHGAAHGIAAVLRRGAAGLDRGEGVRHA